MARRSFTTTFSPARSINMSDDQSKTAPRAASSPVAIAARTMIVWGEVVMTQVTPFHVFGLGVGPAIRTGSQPV